MHETPHGFFHLDPPAAGLTPAAGAVTFQGWAAGPPGLPLVDLRVRHGATLHPVVHGFPRADLATFFKLTAPFLPGGFETKLNLPPGPSELTFEALDIGGAWHPLHTLRLVCSPATTPPAEATPSPVVHPHEFARAVLASLRTTVADISSALPLPAVLRFPHLPFHGHLHQPTLLERVLFGRLRIEGWLFHETSALRRVVASVDLQTWQDLSRGGAKPYVAALYPQFPQARDCRIDGLIDVPAQLPGPLCLRLYAELADGTWHLCHVQRVAIWDQEQEKTPLVPFSPVTFFRTARDLDRACRARGFAIPRPRAFWRGLRGAYGEYRLRARPRVAARANAPTFPTALAVSPPPRRLTLVTHNLALEGAPLFLLELARHFVAQGTTLEIISASKGPLAEAYRALGATVSIVDVTRMQAATTLRTLRHALATLAPAITPAPGRLVIANTLSAWWAVHLARHARRPSLLYIHESTTPATFYLGHMAPATLPLVEQTFRLATHVSFLTETTRSYYRPWLGASNHSLNPGWIDVAAIDRVLSRRSRTDARNQLGLGPAARLVVNIGSVCDRKGQHVFARGVDLFWRQAPELAATCRFLMVGGRDTLFDRDLQRLLARLARPNLEIIPATNEPLIYYQAADLFVCSSYEESLPRVIMEAMACHVPILSTAVHGIRDLLPDANHGCLIPPGDTLAVATGLQTMLTQPELAAQMAATARARVTAHYDAALLLPRHAALAAHLAHAPL